MSPAELVALFGTPPAPLPCVECGCDPPLHRAWCSLHPAWKGDPL